MRFERFNTDIFDKSSSKKFDIYTILNCSVRDLTSYKQIHVVLYCRFLFFSMDIIFSHRQMDFQGVGVGVGGCAPPRIFLNPTSVFLPPQRENNIMY